MAKVAARNASIYLYDSTGACQSLSGLTNQITLSFTADAPEVTAFGTAYKERLFGGIKKWELSLDGFWSSTAGHTEAVLAGIHGASTIFKFGPGGSATGCTMYTACGILSNYEINVTTEDAATVSFTLQPFSGSLNRVITGVWT